MAIVSIGLCSQLTTWGRKLLPKHTDATVANSMMRPPPLHAILPTKWWLSIKLLCEDEVKAASAVVLPAMLDGLLLMRPTSLVVPVVWAHSTGQELPDSSRVPGCSRYDRSSRLPSPG